MHTPARITPRTVLEKIVLQNRSENPVCAWLDDSQAKPLTRHLAKIGHLSGVAACKPDNATERS